MDPNWSTWTTLKQKLRGLLAEYSAEEVSSTLEAIFEQDYAFLKKHFEPKAVIVKHEAVENMASSVDTMNPLKVAKAKIKVHKEPQHHQEQQATDEAPVPQPREDTKAHQEEVLAEQERKEKAKFVELTSQGINPETLLTRENLSDWLITKEYTFAYIARELVGLSQAQVRYAAKAFNIESPISKRRKDIIGNKRK